MFSVHRLFTCAMTVCWALSVACWSGCGPGEQKGAKQPQAPEETRVPERPTSDAPSPNAPSPDAQAPGAADGSRAKASPSAAGRSAAGEVLESMVSAYKTARSYNDGGYMILEAELDGRPLKVKSNYLVAMVRPNKIRLHAHEGIVVCDGEKLRAYVSGIPNQILERDAPAILGLESIFSNNVLADSMARGPTQSFAWIPLQLILLLADDPLTTLLHQVQQTVLLEPGKIDERPCYRVQITRPDGTGVFWIDQKSHVLRRFEFPTDQLQKLIAGGQIKSLSLRAEFTSARLGGQVDPKAFRFEMPPEARLVRELVPPGVQLLGKPSADFIFDGLDGKPVTLKSLSGRVAVIQFWHSVGTSRQMLAEFEQVHQAFKNNRKVTFLAVSLDDAGTSGEAIRQAAGGAGLTAALFRDAQRHAPKAFNILRPFPVTVVIGPKGIVQDYQVGSMPGASAELSRRLNRLLAGEEICSEKLQMFDTMKKEYGRIFQSMLDQNLFLSPMAMLHELPQAGIAEKTAPKLLKLQPLWTCSKLSAAGNILVVPRPGGPPRILVVDAGKTVAEVGPDGKLLAAYPLKIPQQEFVAFLRTAPRADGKRCFVGSAPMMQQFHLFDENWNTLLSYPQNAHKNPHAGIGDVQIADLDGDGSLEIYAGYRGVVGVKAVSPAGKPIWSQRAIANIQRIVVTGPDTSGRRSLLCTNDRVSLAAIDAGGQLQAEVSLGGRLLYWIAAADLDADGQPELCGLTAPELGGNLAVGLDTTGNLLWSYELPKGLPPQWIERVAAGRLSPDGPAQWLFPGPDGSIHIVSADGKPIDQFNYGTALGGLAVTELHGRNVLLVSTLQGLQAWTVDWP